MSQLTEALERISSWLQVHTPSHSCNFLQPGISEAQIQAIAKDLSFKLSPEISELYQWKNGSIKAVDDDKSSAYIFYADASSGYGLGLPYGFLSLHNLVVKCQSKFEDYNSKPDAYKSFARTSPYLNPNWIPLFYSLPFTEHAIGYVVIENDTQNLPIIFEDCNKSGGIIYEYASLTSMMLTIAEYYETGNCHYQKAIWGEYIGCDRESTDSIWYKYNGHLIEEALVKLKSEFSLRTMRRLVSLLCRNESSRSTEILIQLLTKKIPESLASEESCSYFMDIREFAVKSLVERGDPSAIKILVCDLQNPNDSIRWIAVRALGELGDKRVVKLLIEVLNDSDRYIRASAADALGKLTDIRAVEPLIQALSDSDSYVRGSAASALGNLKDARAVEPLIQALNDRGVYVRQSAAKALGNLTDSRAVEPLIQALNDSDLVYMSDNLLQVPSENSQTLEL